MIIPVVLCGGAGIRLWPLSRDGRPKPFIPLVGGRSTFAMTLERVSDRDIFGRPLIVAHKDHRFLLSEALQTSGGDADILLEPDRRDTAAAVVAAATVLARNHGDAILLVLAADHLISDKSAFVDTVQQARAAAEQGFVVTFGIEPESPATSYGYIKRGDTLPGLSPVFAVAGFTEKPDAVTAQQLVDTGYLWNSGNFMMRASVAIAEAERYAPEIAAAASAAADGVDLVGKPSMLVREAYERSLAVSFDKAVMERTGRAAVIEARFDWRDIGSWESLGEIAQTDAAGNATVGDVTMADSRRCYVHAATGKVALLGVDDLVVATSGDAVLVAARDRLESMKDLVADLDEESAARAADDTYKVTPWGYFQVVDAGAGYKVKRIVVEGGARLSLQRHRHRAEHWTVVGGIAEVTVGDKQRCLEANQSILIPCGAVHRLANPGDDPLTVVEVQYGEYLGEDDIERLADDYDRGAE